MNEEQRKANRQGNIYGACMIAYALYCAVIAIGSYNEAPAFQGRAIGLCVAPLLTLVVVPAAWNYVADILQYYKEGWNFDRRQTRSKFYYDEQMTRLMSPRMSFWFGYPFWILMFGGFAILMWANVFGYWG